MVNPPERRVKEQQGTLKAPIKEVSTLDAVQEPQKGSCLQFHQHLHHLLVLLLIRQNRQESKRLKKPIGAPP